MSSSEPCPSCGTDVGDHAAGTASSCPLAGPIRDHHEFMEAARRSHQEVIRMSRVARLTGRASLAPVSPEPATAGKAAEALSGMLHKAAPARTGPDPAVDGAVNLIEACRYRRLAEAIADPVLARAYMQKAIELERGPVQQEAPPEPVMRRWTTKASGLDGVPWGYQPPRSN